MTPQTGLHFDAGIVGGAWGWMLIAVGAAALVLLGYRHLIRNDPAARRLVTLRLLAVGVVLVALLKPSCVSQEVQQHRPVVAVVVDDSQSMSLPAAGGAAQQTRWEQARAWWDSADAAALRERFDVRSFDLTGRPLDAAPLTGEPSRESSDITAATSVVAQRARSLGAAAVLLISDGRDTTGIGTIAPLRDLPLPVHTLRVGGDAPPRDSGVDVRVVSVDAPPRVIVGNAAPLSVRLSASGGSASTVAVSAQIGGRTLAAAETSLDRGEREVVLDVPMDQPGDFVVRVTALPPGGDAAPLDNTATVRVRVDATPLRVLYLEGVLRPEHTFLDERLSNDPDVDLITLVRSGVDPVGEAAAALLTDGRLAALDVVLLGDIDAGLLGGGADERLRRWVEAGGGLMVLAGYRNLDADGLPATALRDALPAELSADGADQVNEPTRFSPTDAGLRHPILRLGADAAGDRTRWEEAPLLRGYVATGTVKPAAQVLVQGGGDAAPLLVVQPYGKGQVALLNVDTTWRWSRHARLRGEPDTLYRRFWSQSIRWLAGRDAEGSSRPVTVTTDHATYERGGVARIRATISGDQPGPPQVSVRSPQGEVVQVALSPAALEPGVWSGDFQPTAGGVHTVEAALAGDADAPGGVDESSFTVAGAAIEMGNPRPDPALLRQIASVTGGRSAAVDDAGQVRALLDAIPAEPRVRSELRARGLWNSPLTLALFVGLVSTEWVLRRRRRLA